VAYYLLLNHHLTTIISNVNDSCQVTLQMLKQASPEDACDGQYKALDFVYEQP